MEDEGFPSLWLPRVPLPNSLKLKCRLHFSTVAKFKIKTGLCFPSHPVTRN